MQRKTKTQRLTIGSLFSGIGGLELGLEWAGLGPVLWQVEKDPYCLKVLEKHWPDVRRYDDVRKIDRTIKPVDIICGGFPCQDVSCAGRGAGIKEGTRSGLWFEFARIIRELRPRVVIVENVPALLTRGMDIVLGQLAALGYDAWWDCIPAQAVGAPHRRDRVFIIAREARGRIGPAWARGAASFDGGKEVLANTESSGESIPHTKRNKLRDESRRSSGQDRADSAEFTNDGEKGALADAQNTDWGRTDGEENEGWRHQEIRRCSVERSRIQHWTTLARFCRMVDGFSKESHGDQP